MKTFGDVFKPSDWKTEKHVPLIECPESIKKCALFDIKVTIVKEVAHPNTTDHHIRWIQVFFHPDGGKFSYQLANCEFSAHGASAEGADKSPAYTNHSATIAVKLSQQGTIYAISFCNIHGLWENGKSIKVD
ncbi:MAG: class II SORL domain-containing protein [Nitrospirota bacterium]